VGGHPVDPALINHGVQVAAVGTVAEGMEVDVVMEPTVLVCRSCGHRTSADDAFAMIACRQCGGLDIDADGSEEVVLESITVDVPAGEVRE
jgi:hydrogenase nickel incorporation protein HypA/HybF